MKPIFLGSVEEFLASICFFSSLLTRPDFKGNSPISKVSRAGTRNFPTEGQGLELPTGGLK